MNLRETAGVRPYAQFCPVAKASEVLGERWSLLILRDLLAGRRRFNELARGLPGISRALLTKRLRQLEAAGLVERTSDGQYALTDAGAELEPVIFSLGEWGARHAFGDPTPEELDPDVLLWWIRGRIDREALPRRIVTLQFVLRDHPHRYWLVIEPDDVSVCLTDPGFEVDVEVRAGTRELYDAYLGRISLDDALRSGVIELHGGSDLTRTFTKWFRRSPVAYMFASQATAH